MSKTLEAQGEYKVKDTGETVSFDFEYSVFDNVQDAVDTLGEDRVKSLIQRQEKVDKGNLARSATQVANGHSARQPMSEEQKAVAKATRAENNALLAEIAKQGLSLEDLKNR